MQVNTEPAKSKTFNLVVNKQEVEEGSKEEAWGRKSEDVSSTSGEILVGPHGFVLGEDFGDSSEVLVRSGLEANTVRPVMVSSEAEVPVVTTKHQEEKEEQEVEEVELLEKEKQSRSIVSVRLGEEGSRFSFAKVIHFSQCRDDIANIMIFFINIFLVILYHHTRWKWAKNQVTAQLWR